jgi:hypothetical protein
LNHSIESSEKNADEMLLKIIDVEKQRPLCPMELVWKGRYIQMGSGAVISDYREAQLAQLPQSPVPRRPISAVSGL